MIASIFWDSLTLPEEADFYLPATPWITLSQQGGDVPTITIITGDDGSMIPIAL